MASEGFINENLELYLNYEYLTADQYSKIIQATNGVYKTLANALIFGDMNYFNSPYIITYPIPLCLEEVRTGNSINTKFSFAKRFFPGIKIENNETINIILPKWSAILIVAGVVLTYGMDRYKDYLDIRLKQLEVNEKTRTEAKAHMKRLEDITSNANNPTTYILQQNINLFKSQIHQPNIQEVRVNGQQIFPTQSTNR
jgi:hypothetical protein